MQDSDVIVVSAAGLAVTVHVAFRVLNAAFVGRPSETDAHGRVRYPLRLFDGSHGVGYALIGFGVYSKLVLSAAFVYRDPDAAEKLGILLASHLAVCMLLLFFIWYMAPWDRRTTDETRLRRLIQEQLPLHKDAITISNVLGLLLLVWGLTVGLALSSTLAFRGVR